MRYILAFVLLITGLLQVSAQSAGFTMSDSVKCGDSLYVSFTNMSIQGTLARVSFKWDFGNGQSSKETSPQNVLFAKPGKYVVTLTMTNTENASEFFTFTDNVFVSPRPNANFFIADTFNLGPLHYLFKSGRIPSDTIHYKYEWTLRQIPDGPIDYNVTHIRQNDNIRDTLIYPFASEGTYYMTLKVSDHHNCKDELTQRFSVSEKLIVPKAFTPNGDNLNDFFVVQTNGRTTYKLQIFNMNGQLVFKSDSKSIIWDGNFTNGSKAAPGTYLYIIEPESGAGSKRISGFVMLLRQYDK